MRANTAWRAACEKRESFGSVLLPESFGGVARGVAPCPFGTRAHLAARVGFSRGPYRALS